MKQEPEHQKESWARSEGGEKDDGTKSMREEGTRLERFQSWARKTNSIISGQRKTKEGGGEGERTKLTGNSKMTVVSLIGAREG